MKGEYISKDDAKKYMQMNERQFGTFSKEYLKDIKRRKGRYKFYSKCELDYYINLRNKWNQEYLYYDNAVELATSKKIFETITQQNNIKPVKKPAYAKHVDDKGFSYYHKKTLEMAIADRRKSRIEVHSQDKDNYISIKDMRKKLGVVGMPLPYIESELNLKTMRWKNEIFISNSDMKKLLNLQNDFLSNHISLTDAYDILGETRVSSLERVKVPAYAKKSVERVMVRKIDFERLKNEVFHKVEGIEKNKAMEILNLSSRNFYKTTQLFDIKSEIEKSTGKAYYKESDIKFILKQREEFGKRYITFDTVKSEYGSTVACKIRGFKAPALIYTRDLKQRVVTIYDRVDAEKIASEISEAKLFHNIIGETNYDTFLLKLDMIEELSFLNNSVYTKNKWFEYVYGVLSTSTASKISMQYKISGLINSSRALDRMLQTYKVKEIYQLTPKLINPIITGSTYSVSIAISQFCISVFKDVKIKLEESNRICKGYSVSDLASPYDKRNFNEMVELGEIEIYSFEEYKSLFNFLIDIDYHVDKILKGDFYKHKDGMTQMVYPSIWLYLILHLNNAWRHGDVSTFPRIEIADLICEWGIDSVEWFKDNKISLNQARILTSRVIQKEFLISKTQMSGHFFCSDNLSPAFATVVIILELYLNDMGVYSGDSINEPLMYFDSKEEAPSNYTIDKFFEGSKLDKFIFKSRKMNKTIMSFVFSLTSKTKNANRVLEIVRQLRGQEEDSSAVLNYVKFDIEEIEFLTELLFRRGEFGYITEKLLDITGMSLIGMDEKSIAIESVNNMFGDYEKVEAVTRFVGKFNSDKNRILKILKDLTLDEALDILIDIYCEKLPSKEKDIQCLVSKTGCVNPKSKCKDCAYHIPSLYALNSILSSLREDVMQYFNEKNIGKKMKLTALINRKIEIMDEAVSKYGEEVVFNYLQFSRDDFLKLYNNIPDTEDLYNYILTHNK